MDRLSQWLSWRPWLALCAGTAGLADPASTLGKWLPWLRVERRARVLSLDPLRCALLLGLFALGSAALAWSWQWALVRQTAERELAWAMTAAEQRAEAIRSEMSALALDGGALAVSRCDGELPARISREVRRSLLLRDLVLSVTAAGDPYAMACTAEGPVPMAAPARTPVGRLVLSTAPGSATTTVVTLRFTDGVVARGELDPRVVEIHEAGQRQTLLGQVGRISLHTPDGHVLTHLHAVAHQAGGEADTAYTRTHDSQHHAFQLRWTMGQDEWTDAWRDRLWQVLAAALMAAGLLITVVWLRTVQRARITYRLERALRKRQFIPFLQPIISMHDGRCIGAEVLMRWQHPERGIVAPGEFIEAAERSGLIGPMSELVMTRTAARLASLAQANPHLYFSFNLTPAQLRAQGFDEWLNRCFNTDTLPRGQVLLEVTERDAVEDGSRDALWNLHQQGWRLAIDDFGTGHSSLALLETLPIDCLKIDRAFVKTIGQDTTQAPVLDSIVQLAGRLKMKLIAEGIETREQWNYLAQSQVHAAQGFLMARPMAMADFVDWQAQHEAQNAAQRRAAAVLADQDAQHSDKAAPCKTRMSDAALTELWQRMSAAGGLDIRDRRYRLTNYPRCFVARDAVDWIVHDLGVTRDEAVRIGQRLEAQGWIRHVADEHGFSDAELFFAAKAVPAAAAQQPVPMGELRTALRNASGGPRWSAASRGLVRHRDVATGSELVSWIATRWKLPREAATRCGISLMASGALRHVFDDRAFGDSNELYRLG
jgi:EAL domain-containing protein (putative c-di-GMP-specific phosphodiesterase class I)